MKKNHVIALLLLIFLLTLLPGCGKSVDKAAEAAPVAGVASVSSSGSTGSAIQELQPKVKEEIQNTIRKYFEALYAESIESYTASTATGTIPDGIKPYIADRMLKEGDMNPEVPIHLPRYLSINGLTAISYSFDKAGEKPNGTSQVEVVYLGKKDDYYLFFAKVNLFADCMEDNEFNKFYKQNEITKVYEKIPDTSTSGSSIEQMKLQAKYDIKVVEEDGKYKILSETESSTKDGVRNRMFVLNNDFVTRLPYLDLAKTQDGKEYVNKEDGAVYDRESALISKLFENMQELDGQRMSLLRQRWAAGQKEFSDFLALTGVNKDGDAGQLMEIGSDYRNRFDIDSFPLQSNMDKLTNIANMTIVPYISYSSNQKVYSVKYEINVRKIYGLIDNEAKYKYNYKVRLTKNDSKPMISEIRLNEYFSLNN